MGFSPAEVNRMSIWQFTQAVEGFNKANNPDAGNELSQAEADDLWQWLQSDTVH